ncbi:DNA polymerase delta, subunit 4-domain-containing protein [Rhodotorula diobovata]|uniref:DNA polymerase delta, subunit 4-domain-containing protein n=1 Tax=Rhodotorula diobovata TaxID=5288 RepID=A0A5C5G050_9BASI|nr:DNA polymerase delta, subunit 4-domain-containing protein [Rhodotorula diobovata]
MPPRTKSSTSKTSSSAKSASLGFGSTKKGVASSAAKGGSKGSLARQDSGTNPAGAAKGEDKLKPSSISGLYPGLYKKAQRLMGKPIHADDMDDIEIILRVFDAEEEYGPCSRISRLERFERAEKLGLNPDPEIGEILRSDEAKQRKSYSESTFQI